MQLPVLGTNGKSKWVLYTSQNSTMQYFVGEFDGQQFLSDNPNAPILKQDHGLDYYAAVAYHQTANKDIISIGWVNSWNYANAIPTKPWKGAMSIPRKLALKKMGDEYQLVQTPIDALKTLRQTLQSLPNKSLQNTETLLLKGSSYEMQFRLIPGAQTQSGIRLAVGAGRYLELGYDASKQVLYLDRSKTPSAFNARYAELSRAEAVLPNTGKIDLRIFLDASILEVYAADGTVVMTAQVFPEPGDTGIQLFSNGGISQFEGIQFWKMGSVH
jgi:fructan beta-fructosidase